MQPVEMIGPKKSAEEQHAIEILHNDPKMQA
jgi:hypothetical protein